MNLKNITCASLKKKTKQVVIIVLLLPPTTFLVSLSLLLATTRCKIETRAHYKRAFNRLDKVKIQTLREAFTVGEHRVFIVEERQRTRACCGSGGHFNERDDIVNVDESVLVSVGHAEVSWVRVEGVGNQIDDSDQVLNVEDAVSVDVTSSSEWAVGSWVSWYWSKVRVGRAVLSGRSCSASKSYLYTTYIQYVYVCMLKSSLVDDLPPMSMTHWSPAAMKLKANPTPRTSVPASKQIVLSAAPLVICRQKATRGARVCVIA